MKLPPAPFIPGSNFSVSRFPSSSWKFPGIFGNDGSNFLVSRFPSNSWKNPGIPGNNGSDSSVSQFPLEILNMMKNVVLPKDFCRILGNDERDYSASGIGENYVNHVS